MKHLAQIKIDEAFKSPWGLRPAPGGTETGSIGILVSLFLNVSFAISGVIILFMLIYAGFKTVQGAGSGDPKSAEQAKQAATSAAIGFVIIFSAFWIIRLIELITGETFITNPGF